MAEAGIVRPDERVELIEGEIFELSLIGSRNAACVNCLLQLCLRQLGSGAKPVQLSDRYDGVQISQPGEHLTTKALQEISIGVKTIVG